VSHKNSKKYARKRKQNKFLVPVLLGLVGLLLILLAGLAWWGSAKSNVVIKVKGAPALQADREFIDLGEVKLGRVVKVDFELTNVGDQTLRFSQLPYVEVKEGC
jgi:hypothetical protein